MSLICSLTYSGRKNCLFWPSRGFEPTHLGDPLDQRRFEVEGLADSATATQGGMENEK